MINVGLPTTIYGTTLGVPASVNQGLNSFATVIQITTPALAGLLLVTHRGFDTTTSTAWVRSVLTINLASIAGTRYRDLFCEYDDGTAEVDFQFVGVLGTPAVVYRLAGV